MAPRIQSQRVSNTLLPYLTSSSSTSSPSFNTSLCSPSQSLARQFSATAAPQTKLRRQMFEWLNTDGVNYKHHVPGEMNYLVKGRRDPDNPPSNRPFPNNRNFVSESVLSEELRNEVYVQVVDQKKSVRAVSVEFGIDMKRIAAVVRLVELERRQRSQGKSMAMPYARAVHEMVPLTPLAERPVFHEPINDLPAHPSTGAQIFYPTTESRSFTRIDAGRVFSAAPELENCNKSRFSHPSDLADIVFKKPRKIEWVGKGDNARQVLQPADVRIPHPQQRRAVIDRHAKRLAEQEKVEQKQRERSKEIREKRINHVEPEGGRFDFRIQDAVFSNQTVGHDGRAPWAPGRRYGVPTNDRKRGVVKIPTRVEA
ncbi:hypothetical protein N7478_005534 [Penicillium angulare]|uniref:uncharacterized protein n=1 Tax=Penicillium angulare TaxID=116970 RepID=UPI002540DEE5|nr:uncharacterized protein N7478_005534 [Penicillium angulare]KAJ5280162.1 hypothetical protein N7478_005534 [Penicillium angulare]